jgi:hypothetical protein
LQLQSLQNQQPTNNDQAVFALLIPLLNFLYHF